MEFKLAMDSALQISDEELSALLKQVYIDGGFTEPEIAQTLFAPAAVRERGMLIGARDAQTFDLAGIVIVVPPDSSACRLAQGNEVEMHLLGVKPVYRGHGLGRRLVEAALDTARSNGYHKMILWTQTSMQTAQKLYEAVGFVRVKEKDLSRNGRYFLVYERDVSV